MRAMVIEEYGDEDVFQLQNIEEPKIDDNQVKIDLYYAGVNPSETYTRTGTYAGRKPDLPAVLGVDGAGVIVEVGKDVKRLKIGDRVFLSGAGPGYTSGTYAEKVVADENIVHNLPDHMSFKEGAAIGLPAAAIYRGIFQRGELKPGEKVLIHGASGGVGLLGVQMAKAVGAYVVGTGSSKEGRDLIERAGADFVLDHGKVDYFDDLPENIKDGGFDLIIEMLANVNLERDFDVLKDYGRIVVIGNRGSLDFNPRLIMQSEADIRGMILWKAKEEEYYESLYAISSMLENKVLKAYVGSIIPLEEVSRAHREIISKKSTGKIVLEIKKE